MNMTRWSSKAGTILVCGLGFIALFREYFFGRFEALVDNPIIARVS